MSERVPRDCRVVRSRTLKIRLRAARGNIERSGMAKKCTRQIRDGAIVIKNGKKVFHEIIVK